MPLARRVVVTGVGLISALGEGDDVHGPALASQSIPVSTDWAPWYVVPADRKWFARISVSAILADTLIKLNPQYPAVSQEFRRELQAARGELVAEEAS